MLVKKSNYNLINIEAAHGEQDSEAHGPDRPCAQGRVREALPFAGHDAVAGHAAAHSRVPRRKRREIHGVRGGEEDAQVAPARGRAFAQPSYSPAGSAAANSFPHSRTQP